VIPIGEMIKMIIEGELVAMPSTLHQSDTFFQRGRDYSDEGGKSNQRIRNTKKDQWNLDRGSIPKESAYRGSIPKESSIKGSIPEGRYTFTLMSKGGR